MIFCFSRGSTSSIKARWNEVKCMADVVVVEAVGAELVKFGMDDVPAGAEEGSAGDVDGTV